MASGIALSGFAEAELISWAPKMHYNDTDFDTGTLEFTGFHNGTRIGNDWAGSLIFGGRLTVALN